MRRSRLEVAFFDVEVVVNALGGLGWGGIEEGGELVVRYGGGEGSEYWGCGFM